MVSMISTKYSHYSNSEFLNLVENLKHKSPIIFELITRLENSIIENSDEGCVYSRETNISCPVCESELILDVEDGRISISHL